MGRVAGCADGRLIHAALDGLAVDAFVVALSDLRVAGAAQFRDRLLKGPGVGPLQLVGIPVANLAVRSRLVSAGERDPMHAARPLAGLLCMALGTLGQGYTLGMGKGFDSRVALGTA